MPLGSSSAMLDYMANLSQARIPATADLVIALM